MTRVGYGIVITLISAAFIPLNIAALALLGIPVSWTYVGVIVVVLLTADIILFITTGKPSKPKRHAANSAKSAY
jgi:hypothetical protein